MGFGEEPITISADNFKEDVDKFMEGLSPADTETSDGNMALDESILPQSDTDHVATLYNKSKNGSGNKEEEQKKKQEKLELEKQNVQKIVEALEADTTEDLGSDLTNLVESPQAVIDVMEKAEIEISESLIREGNLSDIHDQIMTMKKYCEDNVTEIESIVNGEDGEANAIKYVLQNYNQ